MNVTERAILGKDSLGLKKENWAVWAFKMGHLGFPCFPLYKRCRSYCTSIIFLANFPISLFLSVFAFICFVSLNCIQHRILWAVMNYRDSHAPLWFFSADNFSYPLNLSSIPFIITKQSYYFFQKKNRNFVVGFSFSDFYLIWLQVLFE